MLARIEPTSAASAEMPFLALHPALLDAALQAVAVLMPEGDKTYLPMSVESMKVFDRLNTGIWCHAVLKSEPRPGSDIVQANLELFDENGRQLVVIDGFTMKQAASTSIESWLYEVKWQKAQSGKGLDARDLSARLQPAFTKMAKAPDMAAYHRAFQPRMDALCAVLIHNALVEMGWQYAPGMNFSFEDVSANLNVAGQHRRLLARLLEVLEEESILTRSDGLWQVARAVEKTDSGVIADELRTSFPAARMEVDMVLRIGVELGPAMQGQRDPLELLFPGGSMDETVKLYRDAPLTRSFNQLVAQAVREIKTAWKEDRPIRILEIGAGTGGTTAHVLAELAGAQVEYTFTDVSPLFLNKAREKFAAYGFVRYQTLDIERDPAGQGFEPHRFDLILATNVLHATVDLTETVKRVRQLLAPAGLLLAVEGTRKQRFADLVVGLTPGWWAFSDTDLRESYALISQPQWLELLARTGFASADGLTGQAAMSNQVLLIAQAPQAAAIESMGNWLIFAGNHPMGGALAERLHAQNQAVSLVRPGDGFAHRDDQYQVNAASVKDFQQLVQDSAPCTGIVYLWALDEPDPGVDVQASLCGGLLHLVQALIASGKTCPVWVVTQGAQSPNGQTPAPHQATLWGLCKVIYQEHPELTCLAVDL